MLTGNQCCTECAHDAGDVGTDRLTACDFFEAAQYSIIIEGTALNDDLTAQLGSIGHLDNFK